LLPRLRSLPGGRGSGTSHGPAQGCLGHLRRLAFRSRAGHGPLCTTHTSQPVFLRPRGRLSPGAAPLAVPWTWERRGGSPVSPLAQSPGPRQGVTLGSPGARWGTRAASTLALRHTPDAPRCRYQRGVSSSPSLHTTMRSVLSLGVQRSVLCAGLSTTVFVRRAACLARRSTAPRSAVPAVASGTFNPLCKVLCILQSLYLCAIGLTPSVLPCQGYTWRFKLQSQATLLRDTDGQSQAAATHRSG
jgi:hypothetical protein